MSFYSGNKKWVYLIVLSLIWGSSFILIKKSLIGLSPLQLGALRILISGFFVFLFGFKTIKTITKTQWKWLIISGFIGTFFPAFFFAFAETVIYGLFVATFLTLIIVPILFYLVTIFKMWLKNKTATKAVSIEV